MGRSPRPRRSSRPRPTSSTWCVNSFAMGGASRADVLTQQAQLAQSRATLPPLRKQLAQQRNQLTALAGRLPSQKLMRGSISTACICRSICRSACRRNLSSNAPTCAPRRRSSTPPAPDRRCHREPTAAVHHHRHRWHRGARLHQSVRARHRRVEHRRRHHADAVRRRHAAAQEARRRRRVGAGRGAISQHGDQGVPERRRRVARAAIRRRCHASRRRRRSAAPSASLALARVQYQLGGIDYLTLLNADRTWQQARISSCRRRPTRYSDTAALFQALGGGWWHRSDVAPTRSPTRPLVATALTETDDDPAHDHDAGGVGVVLGGYFGFQQFKAKMIHQLLASMANPPQTVSTVTARRRTGSRRCRRSAACAR